MAGFFSAYPSQLIGLLVACAGSAKVGYDFGYQAGAKDTVERFNARLTAVEAVIAQQH